MRFSLLAIAAAVSPAFALTGFVRSSFYITEWIDYDMAMAAKWPPETKAAQQSIIAGADWLASEGPWSVTNKTIATPTGNQRDYYSWSPYWHADCSNVRNTTALTPQQIWKDCNYVRKDGEFASDLTATNDSTSFAALSTAVFFNTLAWRITGDDKYADTAAHFIDTWFTNPTTGMTPNLQYSQVIRGARGSGIGSSVGLLDLHCMTKVVSSILVLRGAKARAWTPALDTAMNNWTRQYIQWLNTSELSQQERVTVNNHGTFWFSQAASLYILVGDNAAANSTLHEFFDGIYQDQIVASGEQPHEAARTLPIHYRSYNIGGLLVLHRIAEHLGWNSWEEKTAAGTTMQDAIDFVVDLKDIPKSNHEGFSEVLPSVAAAAQHYGDADGKYVAFLALRNARYPGEPWFLWNQPLSNNGIRVALDSSDNIIVTDGTTAVDDAKTQDTENAGFSNHHVWYALPTSVAALVVSWLAL